MFSENLGELRISVSRTCHSPALSSVVSFTANLHFLIGLLTRLLRAHHNLSNLEIALVCRHDLVAASNREIPHRQQPTGEAVTALDLVGGAAFDQPSCAGVEVGHSAEPESQLTGRFVRVAALVLVLVNAAGE